MKRSYLVTTARPVTDKIILALDVPDAGAALRMVQTVGGLIRHFKIGLELFTRCGPDIVRQVRAACETTTGAPGCSIFLDLKLHDIPNTVAGAVRAASALEVDMLTVHCSGGGAMLRAAAGAAGAGLMLLGVSVLTSIDEQGLAETGVRDAVDAQVIRLAELSVGAGLRGIVASPWEIARLRARFGDSIKLVIPGVRPAWASSDDQRRVMTPGEAVAAGADYLVIGRPISGQPDPLAAAERIVDEIAAADAAAS